MIFGHYNAGMLFILETIVIISKIITCKFSGSLEYRCCEKCPGEVVFNNVITHSRCLGLTIEPYVQFTSVCHVFTIDLDSEFEELLNI